MKNRRTWIWLAAGVLLIAAFWLLSFRVAVSSNETEKLVMTTNMGAKLPVAMQRREPISVVVLGDGPLASALQKALTREMEAAGLGSIEPVQALEPSYPNPVLVVKVGSPGPLWTPFFASGAFSLHAGYDSGGDTTFMQAAEETHTSVGKTDVTNMYAEYDVRERSMGLISRPGYYQYLAETLAREIVTVLKELYQV